MKTPDTKLIRVGHSPDPDDAFMFYALAHEKIDMRGFKVEHVIEDIESLNQRALSTSPTSEVGMHATSEVSLEVTAVSCHAYAYLADRYLVMRSGASVGDNYGPILVRREAYGETHKTNAVPRTPHSVQKIAIPGKLTTAYLALQLYAKSESRSPSAVLRTPYEVVFVPFDKVFDAVKSGEADYGLVIHEGQITHAEHGLEKVLDLGGWWHEKTKLPLPLGIDVIRRDLGEETIKGFSRLFKESIEYALNHRKDALEYASQFGRGISEDLNDRFVAMYVNKRTLDIGQDGEAGFRKLLDEAYQHGIIPKKVNLEFI
ncbi:MAG: MqnA/MqnD/SBP family protein [Candidatus Omnitrophota bacterium]